MTLDEFRSEVEQQTGVPASLLDGSTAGEIVTMARTILAYKKEHEQDRPKSTKEQFAAWVDACDGIDPQDERDKALDDLARAAEAETSVLSDGERRTG